MRARSALGEGLASRRGVIENRRRGEVKRGVSIRGAIKLRRRLEELLKRRAIVDCSGAARCTVMKRNLQAAVDDCNGVCSCGLLRVRFAMRLIPRYVPRKAWRRRAEDRSCL